MTDRQLSKFSGDINYINRLHYWFVMVAQARLERNIVQYYDLLMVLYTELVTEMSPGEEELFEGLRNMYQAVESAKKRYQTRGYIAPDLMRQLIDYEIKLRKIQKAAGLQNKPMEDDWAPSESWMVDGN